MANYAPGKEALTVIQNLGYSNLDKLPQFYASEILSPKFVVNVGSIYFFIRLKIRY